MAAVFVAMLVRVYTRLYFEPLSLNSLVYTLPVPPTPVNISPGDSDSEVGPMGSRTSSYCPPPPFFVSLINPTFYKYNYKANKNTIARFLQISHILRMQSSPLGIMGGGTSLKPL